MGHLGQDIRYCFRNLSQSPAFTAVVVLTLALGIGANTAIYSVVDAVLLRPLPFSDPDQLVRVVANFPGAGLSDVGLSVPEFDDLRDRSGVFSSLSAMWPIDANVTGAGQPERIELLAVSPTYFSMLGAHAQLGRVFGPGDQAQGFSSTAIISDGLWRRSYGGDPHVLGRRVQVDGDAYTVVGIMPAAFRHPGRTVATDVDMWVTAGFSAAPFPPNPARSVALLPGALGRLKPGLSVALAQQKLDAFTAEIRKQYPNEYSSQARWSIELESLKDSLSGGVRPMLLTVLGAVAMMLLIGCVNIANLLLARSSGRQREIAIRQSLGATRRRLVGQLLTESILLALAAGVVGTLGASWSLQMLLYVVPAKLPLFGEISMNPRVLLFTLALTLITGLAFGLAPAIRASGDAVGAQLREAGRGITSSRQQIHASSMLVAAEVALCLMLMTSAGLLVRSAWIIAHVNPGFNPENAIAAHLWLPAPNNPEQDQYASPQSRLTFIREVLRRTSALPGVTSAAMGTSVPLGNARSNLTPITVEGQPVPANYDATLAEIVLTSPTYFTALGTPLITGRFFVDADQIGSDPVVIVDQATANRYWPGGSAIGHRLKLGRAQSKRPFATIVGIVGDVRHNGIERIGVPHVYFPIFQQNGKSLALIIRSAADPKTLGESLRREIQAVDATLPVFGINTMSNLLESSLATHRFAANLVGAFAGVALLLSAIGIYGVLAYFVGQRTREIGVQMALGAAGPAVVRMVMWQGFRPTLFGTLIGIAASLAFSGMLRTLLYGISDADPLVFVCVPVVLMGVALLACYIPARRATRIDPMITLRCE